MVPGLGFFSRKLDSAQIRYSAYDRELLACVQGIRHFRFMLEGRRFTLYTPVATRGCLRNILSSL